MAQATYFRFAPWFLVQLALVIFNLQCGVKQPKASAVRSQPKVDHEAFKLQGIPCAQCHEHTRSPPNEDIDARGAALRVPHGFGQSCEGCHAFPTWEALSYSHNPPPKACLGCHSLAREGNAHAPRGDCVSCHSFGTWEPSGGTSLFK